MNEPLQQPVPAGVLQVPFINPPPGSIAPIPGLVTQQIGSGDHAQNAIVYRTILWSFAAGGLLSLAAYAHALLKGTASPLGEVKDIWSIFAPLITLALGYLFGKGR